MTITITMTIILMTTLSCLIVINDIGITHKKIVHAFISQEFHKEGDSNTADHHKFPTPVSARYIRFHPTKCHNWNCLRVELYITKGKL